MKIALYTAGAFVAGVFAGRWLLENTVAAEAAGSIAEAKTFYQEKYQKQYEESVRSFVRKWEGEEAAEKLTFKYGAPQLGDLLKTEKPTPEEVEETTVEAAKTLIETEGYTSYNNLKPAAPVRPEGPTTAGEGVKGAYVISQEEFFDRGLDKQNQITYYAGNDTLVSAKGKVVPPADRAVLIGLDALSKFGVESQDDNVVYIRNPSLGAGVDFEITLDEGNYEA
jgi:hypothetical protein